MVDKGGRPPKYTDPVELQEAIDEYFNEIEANDDVPLIEELALHLGFASRQSLNDYEKDKKFSYIVKAARAKCGIMLNKGALKGDLNPQITKLNLTSNYGFTDKQEIAHSGELETKVSVQFGEDDEDS